MYRVRPYAPEDRTRIAHLFRRLWSRDQERNEKYLVWRYEQNPYLKLSLAVAEFDGEIVAVRGAYGMKWRIGDALALMPCAGDTVVDQAHEGNQLVQKLTESLFLCLRGKNVHHVVNQNPGPAVEKISMGTGWRRVGYRAPAKYVRRGDAGARGFDRLDANAANQSGDLKILVQREPPAEIPGLLSDRPCALISHCIDEQYIRWRFNNPFCEYRWLCGYTDRLEGYLALARSAAGSSRPGIWMLDLWGGDGAVQSVLLRSAMAWGEFKDVRLWWNRFPREVSQVLAEYGFQGVSPDAPARPTLLIGNVNGDDDFSFNEIDLLDIRNWDSRMAYSDVT